MKLTTKNLIKAIEKCNNEQKITTAEQLEHLFYDLSQDFEFEFCLQQQTSNDSDWYLQCDYHSLKIDKTIIWEYEYDYNYETPQLLAEQLIQTNKEILAFDKRLSISCG